MKVAKFLEAERKAAGIQQFLFTYRVGRKERTATVKALNVAAAHRIFETRYPTGIVSAVEVIGASE